MLFRVPKLPPISCDTTRTAVSGTPRTAAIAPERSFGDLVLSPNPYYVPSAASLTIDGLVQSSKLKVLRIDGSLVRELETPGGRVGFWDGLDARGR